LLKEFNVSTASFALLLPLRPFFVLAGVEVFILVLSDPHSGHNFLASLGASSYAFSRAVKMTIMMMMVLEERFVPVTRDFFNIFFHSSASSSKGNYINNFVLVICRLYHFSCSLSLSHFSLVAKEKMLGQGRDSFSRIFIV
jgi:hypothetical protein